MKPPRLHRSLNCGAISPAFTALATRPVSASAPTERRAASTTCGSAVTARKIGQCQRRVIGTPAYFAAKGMPQTPADLLAHHAIVYEQRDGGATGPSGKELRKPQLA